MTTTFPMTVKIEILDTVELSLVADAHRQIGLWRRAVAERDAIEFAITASVLNPTVERPPAKVNFNRPGNYERVDTSKWVDPPREGYTPPRDPNGNGDGVD